MASESLKLWYASGGMESLVLIVEIKTVSQSLFLTPSFDDEVEVRLENGDTITATPSPIAVALQDRDNSGSQSLTFGFDNVTGEVLGFIKGADINDEPIYIVYREYLSSDLTYPANKPIVMTVKDIEATIQMVICKASHFDVINIGVMRDKYTATKYPGIRYL